MLWRYISYYKTDFPCFKWNRHCHMGSEQDASSLPAHAVLQPVFTICHVLHSIIFCTRRICLTIAVTITHIYKLDKLPSSFIWSNIHFLASKNQIKFVLFSDHHAFISQDNCMFVWQATCLQINTLAYSSNSVSFSHSPSVVCVLVWNVMLLCLDLYARQSIHAWGKLDVEDKIVMALLLISLPFCIVVLSFA